MANLDYKEKLIGTENGNGVHKIIVSHLTIRQSIFFLHLRLVVIEIIAAFGLILLLTLILSPDIKQRIGDDVIVFNIPFFLALVFIKICAVIFVIVAWLNECYEITTKDIVYRKGLFFRKEERHILEHIGSVTLEQGIFGRIFNFGTLKLFNWTKEKYIYLYLIHNPMKYMQILEKLLPDADKGKKIIREHILEPEDESN
jgi:hypothetical protein